MANPLPGTGMRIWRVKHLQMWGVMIITISGFLPVGD